MKQKFLVISSNVWDDTNVNSLYNLFQNWKQDEIANLYCRDEIPNNRICSNYF